MRRKKPISVKVKAPSRGLVTRWPSETADRMNPSNMLGASPDSQRVCAVAQNVRFEDGVIAAAPGYKRVQLVTSLLTNCISHWTFNEASGTRYDSFGSNDLTVSNSDSVGVGQDVSGKLGACAVFEPALDDPQVVASQYLHSTATALTGLNGADFTVAGWFKGANAGEALQFPGFKFSISGGTFTVLITYSGGGGTSATAAISSGAWNFIAVTYARGAGTLKIYVNGALITTASVGTVDGPSNSDGFQLGFDEETTEWRVDSTTVWSRVLTLGEVVSLYNAGSGLDFPFFTASCNLLYEGNLIGATTRPFVFALGGQIYEGTRTYGSDVYILTPTSRFTGTNPTSGYDWRATDFYDKITFAQKDNNPQYWRPGDSATTALPGIPVSTTSLYTAISDGNDKWEGVESFAGHLLFWKQDLLLWSDLNDFGNYIPVPATIQSSTFTTNASFLQPAVGSTVSVTTLTSAAIATLVAGQYLRLIYTTGGVAYYNYYSFVSTSGATQMTVKLLGTTGRTASGDTIATTQTITTLDANEAGSAQIVGSNANGPIYRIWSVADYAYIYKEWSIQSLQYVGQASGTFALRTEVTREGLLSKNAGVNLGNGTIVFLGHRELYAYKGGPTPEPVCQQYTRQLFEELDRSRIDSIQVFHRERRNEVWVVYPVVGGTKVLIWNYSENTATLDEYGTASLLRSVRLGWPVDPVWELLSVDTLWTSFPDTTLWNDLVSGGNEENFLVADNAGGFWIHGPVYDRGRQAYTALAETMDYDFGDGTQFKYVDVVHVGIQVKASDNATRTLYVQVGGRTSLDADITWTSAQAISVQGNANFTTKVNPGGSGRYLRLRFYSSDVDVQWRVSSFEIYARAGGTY